MQRISPSKMSFKKLLDKIDNEPVTMKQFEFIKGLMEQKHITVSQIIDDGFPPLEKLNKKTGSELLDYLLSAKERNIYQDRYSEFSHISEDLPIIQLEDEY